MLRRRALLAGALLPLLAACATSTTSDSSHEDVPQPAPDDWSRLGVPGLEALIAHAWRVHPDIEAALAAAGLARAAAARAAADRQPLLRFSANHSDTRQSGARSASSAVNVEGSWDLDLGGTLSRASEAARLRAKAQAVLAFGAQASLACETTGALLGACVEVHRRSWALRYLDVAVRRREVVGVKLTAGLVSRRDEMLARANEAAALRQVRRIEGELAEAMGRLASLAGAGAEELVDTAVRDLAATGLPRFELPVQPLAGTAFLRRPDLWAAQVECAAVSVELAAAERANLPKVNLGALMGLAASTLAGLTGAGALLLTLTQAFELDLLDGGRWAAGVEYARANERLAAARYRQKAWSAMQETLVSALRYRLALQELEAAREGDAVLDEALQVSRAARAAGMVDSLPVLDAEQLVLDNQAYLLESAQLLAYSMGRVLSAAAGPLPGLRVVALPVWRVG